MDGMLRRKLSAQAMRITLKNIRILINFCKAQIPGYKFSNRAFYRLASAEDVIRHGEPRLQKNLAGFQFLPGLIFSPFNCNQGILFYHSPKIKLCCPAILWPAILSVTVTVNPVEYGALLLSVKLSNAALDENAFIVISYV